MPNTTDDSISSPSGSPAPPSTTTSSSFFSPKSFLTDRITAAKSAVANIRQEVIVQVAQGISTSGVLNGNSSNNTSTDPPTPSSIFNDLSSSIKAQVQQTITQTSGLVTEKVNEKVTETQQLIATSSPALDALLSKASAEFQSRVCEIEAEIQQKSAALESQYNSMKHELQERYEQEKAEMEKSIKEKAHEMEQKVQEKTRQLEVTLKEKSHEVELVLKEKSSEIEATLRTKSTELESRFNEKTQELRVKLTEEYEARKLQLKTEVLHQFEKMLVALLDEKLYPLIEEQLLDPLMPLFVQDALLSSLKLIWPDIKEEMFDVWNDVVLKYEEIEEGVIPSCASNPLSTIKASFLYYTFPYDRNIWWQLRSVNWWIWLAISACPVFGIQAMYFLCLFLCIDKQDEYQLYNFIIQFKGLQFITLGLMNCVIGGIQYYNCVGIEYASIGATAYSDSVDAAATPRVYTGTGGYIHRCDISGPGGLGSGTYTDMSFFIVQILTIWIALGMLKWSRKKGVRQLAADSPPRHFASAQAGGAEAGVDNAAAPSRMSPVLRTLLIFDTVLFFVLGIATLILVLTRPYRITKSNAFSTYEWLFREDLYWLKTCYGMLSLPWILLCLPFICNILLHLRPTGYNRAGICVPCELKESEEVPEALRRRKEMTRTVQVVPIHANSNSNENALSPEPLNAWQPTSASATATNDRLEVVVHKQQQPKSNRVADISLV